MSDEAQIISVVDFRRGVQDTANRILKLLEMADIPSNEKSFISLAALAVVGCKEQGMEKKEFLETMDHLFDNFCLEYLEERGDD